MITLPFLAETYLVYKSKAQFDSYIDLILFYLLMLLLAFFKRFVSKRNLLYSIHMESQKKELELKYAQVSVEIEEQAIEILHQNKRIINIQNQTIISLSNLVENRDIDTGLHVRRTAKYVNIIANKAFEKCLYSQIITPEYIDLITKSAPLHDIGKIVVPDAVLKKPGRLTDEEFEEIKRHTLEGGRIVKEVLGVSNDKEYIQTASDIATYHHEKWNGTGYPKGLKGEEIPLSARIMAIADVFDALVSKRCYKKEMSFEEAVECIKVSSGSHFQPELVEIFLDCQEDFRHVMEKYKD